jgi:hypothetical protein
MGRRADKLTRDAIITIARYSKITPQEAEAKAVANGWQAFENQPALPAFDPCSSSGGEGITSLRVVTGRLIHPSQKAAIDSRRPDRRPAARSARPLCLAHIARGVRAHIPVLRTARRSIAGRSSGPAR